MTEAEHAVLALLAQGLTYQEIAEQLGISRATVASRVQRVLTVLGARNQTHAIWRAVEQGWLTPARPRGKRHPVPDRRTRRLRPRGEP